MPVQVSGLTGIAQISAGASNGYALASDGTVYGWGDNSAGTVGDGTTTNRLSPVPLTTLTGDRGSQRWGQLLFRAEERWNRLGLGSEFQRPVRRRNDNAANQPCASYWFSAVYRELAEGWGQVLQSVPTAAFSSGGPYCARVSACFSSSFVKHFAHSGRQPKRGIQITGGYESSFAVRDDGSVWGWGDNSQDQLGMGTPSGSFAPIQLTGLSGISSLSLVDTQPLSNGQLALEENGSLLAWFQNSAGLSKTPISYGGLTNVTAVADGGDFILEQKSDGSLWASGANGVGEFGNGTTNSIPNYSTVVPAASGLTGLISIAASSQTGLGLKSDGTVWAWGSGYGDSPGAGFGIERCFGHLRYLQFMFGRRREWHRVAMAWVWFDTGASKRIERHCSCQYRVKF